MTARFFTHLTKTRLLLAAAVLCLTEAGPARASTDVYQRTLRSTTWVVTPNPQKDRPNASLIGSGSLIDKERKLVLTNFHVVQNKSQSLVLFPAFQDEELITDKKHYEDNAKQLAIRGRVVHRDSKRDLALIELERLPEGVEPLPLAARSPSPGQAVHAIGNSGLGNGQLWRYSEGKVRLVYKTRLKSRDDDGFELLLDARLVETQVPTNGGDSGGPVVNDAGELVAVTQSHHPNDRLVTISVDVGEVRAMLGDFTRVSSERLRVAQAPGTTPGTRGVFDDPSARTGDDRNGQPKPPGANSGEESKPRGIFDPPMPGAGGDPTLQPKPPQPGGDPTLQPQPPQPGPGGDPSLQPKPPVPPPGGPDPKPLPKAPPVVGAWRVFALGHCGPQSAGLWQYKADGSFVWKLGGGCHGPTIVPGQFIYTGEVMTLKVEGEPKTVRVNWLSDNRFTVILGRVKLVFDRLAPADAPRRERPGIDLPIVGR